jgi:two-component system NtrC family sensor kinase
LCLAPVTDRPATRYEIGVRRKDGQFIPLEITTSPITYENQPAVQLVGRDMAEPKRRYEQWMQSETLAALGRFTSAVAHELNNPLTVIAGFAEILLSNLNLNEQDQADLQMIASEANRARRMIQDLLRLVRTQPSQKQLVDLNHLIATTVDRHQAELQARRSQVITELASDLPPIAVDPEQLEEVFTTLLIYLRKSLATAPEGGRLRVKTGVKKILSRAGWRRMVEITFVEEGPGRSPDQLRQIFEPNYSNREEDRGLGLALAYHLIRQHEGRMYALSGPGEGVRFIIELPLSDPTVT